MPSAWLITKESTLYLKDGYLVGKPSKTFLRHYQREAAMSSLIGPNGFTPSRRAIEEYIQGHSPQVLITPEQAAADYVLKHMHNSSWIGFGTGKSSSKYVYVIGGGQEWIQRSTNLVQAIAENEEHPDYRIIITYWGQRGSSRWGDHAHLAGLKPKLHADVKLYRTNARELMQRIREQWFTNRGPPPSKALEDIVGAPVYCSGRNGSRRDSENRALIQQ